MSPLSGTEVHALNETLDGEYRAWVIYDPVTGDFGEVRSFDNIREAEACHMDGRRQS